MRFNDAPVNRNDPQDVLRCLNRPIVWHDGRLDITRAVLEIMKANATDEANTRERLGAGRN